MNKSGNNNRRGEKKKIHDSTMSMDFVETAENDISRMFAFDPVRVKNTKRNTNITHVTKKYR